MKYLISNKKIYSLRELDSVCNKFQLLVTFSFREGDSIDLQLNGCEYSDFLEDFLCFLQLEGMKIYDFDGRIEIILKETKNKDNK